MRKLVRLPGRQHGGRQRGRRIVRPPGVNHQPAVIGDVVLAAVVDDGARCVD